MEYKSVKLLLLQLLLLAKVVHPDSYWSEDYDKGTVQLEWGFFQFVRSSIVNDQFHSFSKCMIVQ